MVPVPKLTEAIEDFPFNFHCPINKHTNTNKDYLQCNTLKVFLSCGH